MTTEYNAARARELLIGRGTLLVNGEFSGSPINDTAEFWVEWPMSTIEDIDLCRRYLYDYTFPSEERAASRYVDDPAIRGTQIDGRWRLASVKYVESPESPRNPDARRKWTLVGVYRQGWATSLSNDERRLEGSTGEASLATFVPVVYWSGVDNTEIDDLAHALTLTTAVTDPTIEGETLTGKFAIGKVSSTKTEDGSGVIKCELHKLTTISATTSKNIAAALALLKGQYRYTNEELNAFGFHSGTDQSYLYVIPNIDPDAKAKIETTVLDSDLVAEFGHTGYERVERRVEKMPDINAYGLTLLFKKPTWANTFAADKQEANQSEQGGFSRKAGDIVEGVPTASVATLRSALNTAETATAWATSTAYSLMSYVSSGGSNYVCTTAHTSGTFATDLAAGYWIKGNKIVVQASIQDNKDGSLSGARVQIVGYTGTTSADATVTVIEDKGETTISRVWYQRTAAAAATLQTASTGAARSSYTFETQNYVSVSTQQADNGNGTFTVSQLLVQARTITAIVGDQIAAELASLPRRIEHDHKALSLFGFQEGSGDEVVILIPNLDPSDATWTKCMSTMTEAHAASIVTHLPSTAYGWRYAGRKWRKEQNGSATLAILASKRTWNALVWSGNARNMDHSEPVGWGRAKQMRLTGLTKAKAEEQYALLQPESATAWANGVAYDYMAYVSSDGKNYICITPHTGSGSFEATKFIHATLILGRKSIDYAGDGQYVLSALAIPAYEGTTTADAEVRRLKTATNGDGVMARVWPMRSKAARDTLMTAGSGKAMINDDDWESLDATVSDHGNGTYTVTQLLVNDTDGQADWSDRWKICFKSLEDQWRNDKDGKAVCTTITRNNFYSCRLSERGAYKYIAGQHGRKVDKWGDGAEDVAGTEAHKVGRHGVSQRGRYSWLAFCQTTDPGETEVTTIEPPTP